MMPGVAAQPLTRRQTRPGWVPGDAIAFLDFVNGRYFAGSAQRAIATLLGGGFDAAYITADGMQITTDNLPTADGALFNDFEAGLSAGMTIVFEFSQTTNSAFSNSHFLLSFEDMPEAWILQVERVNLNRNTPNDDFYVADFGDLDFSDHVAEALASGTNRLAVTLGRDLGGGTWQYAVSINGSTSLIADVAYSAADGFATNGLSVVRIGGRFDAWPDGYIRSITLYPAKAPEDLPALTA
ncbi:hypothetical protein [Mesorhizobium sp.]|uniref:hypothetical protein n=1 Tax=Mesorhizobium sp. TaxID=1871066 RepID=UPI000FE9E617|nr:hypothetical protein [Mesorhizobium sp.]RWH32212.1 MAG: hypothetical protein EOQ76_03720 [Mesorhizobium sp.]RWH40838.1 MAG: hypothetical protein EOQ79_02665 [Mesorhizobium sp.]TIR61461.1 MAG: hypothetical protein E5X22_04685 [Mesorhizobium sp.]TIR70645.1 MAG: hypothetical protein E5X24_08395 [Mesorhizobium sp.]